MVFFCCTVGEYWNDALAESSSRWYFGSQASYTDCNIVDRLCDMGFNANEILKFHSSCLVRSIHYPELVDSWVLVLTQIQM